MSDEPDSLILRMLREMRAEMATKSDLAELKSEMAEVKSDIHSLRADVASDLLVARKETSEQIAAFAAP